MYNFSPVNYNIALKIGQVKGDGANGNVYIQLFGENGDSSKMNLRQAGDDINSFKEDDLYRFTVNDKDIGKVCLMWKMNDRMRNGKYGVKCMMHSVYFSIRNNKGGIKLVQNNIFNNYRDIRYDDDENKNHDDQ